MKSKLLLLFSTMVIITTGLTGCGINSNASTNTIKPTVEYQYQGTNVPVHQVTDKYIDNVKVSDTELSKIPQKVGNIDLTIEQRTKYARTQIVVNSDRNIANQYIQLLYNMDSQNKDTQIDKLKLLSYEGMDQVYNKLSSSIKANNLQYKYTQNTINKDVNTDVKVIKSGSIVAGKVLYGVISYKDKSGTDKSDNLEIGLININDTWKITYYKVLT